MSKKAVLVFVSVLLFSILLFVPYGSANQGENCDSIPIVEVFTDKTVYKINETIMIYINVTNPTDSPIILQFSSSHQFDYEIRGRYNNLIYRWSDGKAFLTVLTNITIPAGESYVKSFTHTPQDCSLKPGSYIITGVVVGYNVDTTCIKVTCEIIPEFPSFLIMPLFMIATLLGAIGYRRKHSM